MQSDFFRQLSDRVQTTVEPPRRAPSAYKSGEAIELEKTTRALLHSVGCPELAARIRVRWNARMRSTAGTAHAGKNLITLNPRLRDFGDAEVDRTLRHELAHLLAHHRAGRRRITAHGREWQQACRDLGLLDEKRCHDLPLPRREMTARHFYRCPHCSTVLRRVRPLRGKSACLACCRQHNRGHYAERFRFARISAPPI
jgi:predicted SprT family Zn-dependent metalloprotease